VTKAWNGEPGAGIAAAFKKCRLVPAGIVGASASDPAWTAAVALAAGRGQLLAWIDGDFGGLSTQLNAAQFGTLDAAVTQAFHASTLTWHALGDDLETFTLCRNTALRVQIPAPPGGWDSRLPPRGDGPIAVTDALCRTPDGKRYAFAAQVPGDSVHAAYTAMCSLFLSRTSVFMFDGYADRTEKMFTEYSFSAVTNQLVAAGFQCSVHEGSKATASEWRALLPAGVDADVILVNSAGNSDFFQIGQNDNLWSTQIPVLNRPAALSMVHSFSLQMPDQSETIGARWLEHGVYAYAGSVEEPFLVAFVPPRVLAARIATLTPFLVASRQWEGDFIPQAWRVATLGDPQMTITPPALIKRMDARRPASVPHAPEAGFVELRALAKSSLEATRTATDGTPYAQAMRALVLLGDDRVATQLWGIANSRGFASAVAGDALGPLFRMHDRAGFVQAWPHVQTPSALQRDMLWALWTPGLERLTDRAALNVLMKEARRPRSDMDAEFLLPFVKRIEGRESAGVWLNQLIGLEPGVDGKRRLAELQGKL
jgi:hypothetical protein